MLTMARVRLLIDSFLCPWNVLIAFLGLCTVMSGMSMSYTTDPVYCRMYILGDLYVDVDLKDLAQLADIMCFMDPNLTAYELSRLNVVPEDMIRDYMYLSKKATRGRVGGLSDISMKAFEAHVEYLLCKHAIAGGDRQL